MELELFYKKKVIQAKFLSLIMNLFLFIREISRLILNLVVKELNEVYIKQAQVYL